MSKQNVQRQNSVAKKVYTVPEFCKAHRFSRSTFYKLLSAGLGPPSIKVRNRTLISVDAAETWWAHFEKDHTRSKVQQSAQRPRAIST